MWRRLVESKTISQSQLVVGSIAVVVLTCLSIGLLQGVAAVATLAGERDDIESQTRIQRATLARLSDDAPAVAALIARARAIQQAVPESANVAGLLGELSARAREAGLSIEQIQHRPGKTEEGYEAVSFVLATRGSYPQLTAFLGSLKEMERLVEVSGLSIRVRERGSLDADIDLNTYHLVASSAAAEETTRANGGGIE